MTDEMFREFVRACRAEQGHLRAHLQTLEKTRDPTSHTIARRIASVEADIASIERTVALLTERRRQDA